jgi:hypothetical protein
MGCLITTGGGDGLQKGWCFLAPSLRLAASYPESYMDRMKNKERPSGAVVLGCLFLGAAFLPISYSFLKKIYTFTSWPHFIIIILPQITIYLVCSLLVFNKWDKLSNAKKAVLIGIAFQAYLLLLNSGITYELLIESSPPDFMSSILFALNIIVSPIEWLYQKIIISHRTINSELGTGVITYHWEAGLILPLLRLIYSGSIGGFIGKYVETKKD